MMFPQSPLFSLACITVVVFPSLYRAINDLGLINAALIECSVCHVCEFMLKYIKGS